MASGLTDHLWSLSELLGYKVAPSPWVEPKRRGRPIIRAFDRAFDLYFVFGKGFYAQPPVSVALPEKTVREIQTGCDAVPPLAQFPQKNAHLARARTNCPSSRSAPPKALRRRPPLAHWELRQTPVRPDSNTVHSRLLLRVRA